MNFIARHINTIGILMLTGFVAAAATLYWDVPQKLQKTAAAKQLLARYICPMHPNVTGDKPGDCSICGMKLVAASAVSSVESGCMRREGSGCCGSTQGVPMHAGCNHGNQSSPPTVAEKSNQ